MIKVAPVPDRGPAPLLLGEVSVMWENITWNANGVPRPVHAQIALDEGLERQRRVGPAGVDPFLADVETLIHFAALDAQQNAFEEQLVGLAARLAIAIEQFVGRVEVTQAAVGPGGQKESVAVGRPDFQALLQVRSGFDVTSMGVREDDWSASFTPHMSSDQIRRAMLPRMRALSQAMRSLAEPEAARWVVLPQRCFLLP